MREFRDVINSTSKRVLGLFADISENLGNYSSIKRSFAYAGPATWNSLPEHLQISHSHPTRKSQQLQVLIKDPRLRTNDTSSALETFSDSGLYKFAFYLLTYYIV